MTESQLNTIEKCKLVHTKFRATNLQCTH